MKCAKVLHNPTAGEGEHTKKKLISLLETAGYTCSYSSTKEDDWYKIKNDTDFIVAAGGDGTIRRLAEELLDKRILDKKYPIGLLPFGTANNIAKTLGLPEKVEDILERWKEENIMHVDVGKIHDLKKTEFFLEAFGFGVFPELMIAMKKRDHEEETPEQELIMAQQMLLDIVRAYPGTTCTITLDGVEHTGNFLLCEIMNTRSVGPNLVLAPEADPGDGEFEVVLIEESQRDALLGYIQDKLNGKDPHTSFSITRTRKVIVKREGTVFHSDDELIKTDAGREIHIELLPGVIDFLV
jgi:diacylglycerol kinase (ATP)